MTDLMTAFDFRRSARGIQGRRSTLADVEFLLRGLRRSSQGGGFQDASLSSIFSDSQPRSSRSFSFASTNSSLPSFYLEMLRKSLSRRRSEANTVSELARLAFLWKFLAAGEDDSLGDIEDDRQLSREKLLEKIREKKEVIEKLRCQPWSMRRKLRTLRLAHKYLQRHEAKVSKTHLWKEEMDRKWRKFKRWLSNFSIYLIPWEARIKKIESHFGSVVSSYFIFLRWIFWVNFIITLFMMGFIAIPEMLADLGTDVRANDMLRHRKSLDKESIKRATFIQTIWDFEGYLRVSPMFYGFYAARDTIGKLKYQLPLAYFVVYVVVLAYSFWAILRKMAANARMSKMASGKAEQYTFGWKVFTGWDYTIGNSETAANTLAANANKLRETIAEHRAAMNQKLRWLRIVGRIFANILIFGMVAASTYLVYTVVERSRTMDGNANAFRKNEVPIVVSLITLFFPNIFELIGRMERYHPRTQLRIQLARILLLYLLNFYTLIFALFTKMRKIVQDDAQRGEQLTSLWGEINDTLVTEFASTDMPVTNTLLRYARSLAENITSRTLNSAAHGAASVEGSTQIVSTVTPMIASSLPLSFLNVVKNYLGKWTQVPLTFTSPATMVVAQNSTLLFTVLSPTFLERNSRQTSKAEGGGEEPATGPLTFTTDLPGVGKVGVDNANATLYENVSKSRQNEISPLEIVPLKSGGRAEATPKYETSPFVQEKPPDETRTLEPVWPPGYSGTEGSNEKEGVEDYEEEGNIFSSLFGDSYGPSLRLDQSLHDAGVCWETYMGQEICRLITMDLIMTLASILMIDFFRGLVVKYCNHWWCWNLETQFPEYGEFKVAENVLHLINNQGMIWLGLFFAPLLPAMNNIKLIILMYMRSWACMTCNVPAQQVFRASRSSNFYLLLLLLMLVLCTLPVGFLVASQRPSTNCGPFADRQRFYHIITDKIKENLPAKVYSVLDHIASPGVVIPILVLLLLIIYFLVSLSRALKESNEDLKEQLQQERTEEKRKVYAMAGGGTSAAVKHEHSPNVMEAKELIVPAVTVESAPISDTGRDSEKLSSSSSDESLEVCIPLNSSMGGMKPDVPSDPLQVPMGPMFIPSLTSLTEESSIATDDVESKDRSGSEALEIPLAEPETTRIEPDSAKTPTPTDDLAMVESGMSRSTPSSKSKTPGEQSLQDLNTLLGLTSTPDTILCFRDLPDQVEVVDEENPEVNSERLRKVSKISSKEDKELDNAVEAELSEPKEEDIPTQTKRDTIVFTPEQLARMLAGFQERTNGSVKRNDLIQFSESEQEAAIRDEGTGTDSEMERFAKDRMKRNSPLQTNISGTGEEESSESLQKPPTPKPRKYIPLSEYTPTFSAWPVASPDHANSLKPTFRPKALPRGRSQSADRSASSRGLRGSTPSVRGNTPASPLRRPRFWIKSSRESSPAYAPGERYVITQQPSPLKSVSGVERVLLNRRPIARADSDEDDSCDSDIDHDFSIAAYFSSPETGIKEPFLKSEPGSRDLYHQTSPGIPHWSQLGSNSTQNSLTEQPSGNTSMATSLTSSETPPITKPKETML